MLPIITSVCWYMPFYFWVCLFFCHYQYLLTWSGYMQTYGYSSCFGLAPLFWPFQRLPLNAIVKRYIYTNFVGDDHCFFFKVGRYFPKPIRFLIRIKSFPFFQFFMLLPWLLHPPLIPSISRKNYSEFSYAIVIVNDSR